MAEMATLLLRFSDPLQSWGIESKGSVRHSATEPSLSGVLGLVSNALGLSHGQRLPGSDGVQMGVRVDRTGVLTRDFYSMGTVTGVATVKESWDETGRTLKTGLDTGGVVGEKFFLSGAVFTVALRGEREVLQRWAEALHRPARILYLGRKCFPMGPDPVLGLVDDEVEQALRTAPLAPGMVPAPGARRRAWHADERMRLVLPCTRRDIGAQARHDVPLGGQGIERSFANRWVRHDLVAAD